MHIREQGNTGPIEKPRRDDQFSPVVQRLIEAVRMLEFVGLATVHEVLFGLTHVLEQSVGDVRVRELVLDDRVRTDLRIGRWGVPGRPPVRGSAHELGVGLNRELHHQRFSVALGHVRDALDHEPFVDLLLELFVGESAHRTPAL